MGLLDGVHRTTAKGWEVLGVGTAGLFSEGQGRSTWSPPCPRCTPPSRHWSRCSSGGACDRALRPLLALYPLAMGLTLIATGEHYFFDVLLGWIYAGAVMAAWGWWSARGPA